MLCIVVYCCVLCCGSSSLTAAVYCNFFCLVGLQMGAFSKTNSKSIDWTVSTVDDDRVGIDRRGCGTRCRKTAGRCVCGIYEQRFEWQSWCEVMLKALKVKIAGLFTFHFHLSRSSHLLCCTRVYTFIIHVCISYMNTYMTYMSCT